ncbi:MAG: 4-hydroxy-3-methylbut-2-enyl diphosphate reductase [Candidatus Methylopumilus sp.]|nr:4-hydroxy-3-methylbut-2-enyl diphosphate reductase [Candidatus Methylopumilus sp.]
MKEKINILLANPRGFCAGVDRAIQIVEEALQQYGKPIYVRHEVVHNQYVINDLKTKGAVFIEDLNDAPKGAHVIFSAHGISKAIRQEAERRELIPIDATCPLVTKVHVEVNKMLNQGMDIIMIGHQGHPEVEGTMGQIEKHHTNRKMYLIETLNDISHLTINETGKIAYVTQTTLSIDDTKSIIEALKIKYPKIQGPKSDNICYATQNRQDAVKHMSGFCDLIIIVGSSNSSNSNRLKELASKEGIEAYMIDHEEALQPSWLINKKNIGISAGASAPEVSVSNIIQKIESLTKATIKELPGIKENVIFKLPKI